MKLYLHRAAISALLLAGGFECPTRAEEPKTETKKPEKAKSAAARAAAGIFKAVKSKPRVDQVRAMAPAVVVAPAAVEAAPDDAFAEQILQQYRPLLDEELELVRQTCDLTPEQRPKIKAAGVASLKKAATVAGGQIGRRIVVNGAATGEPRKSVRAGLGKALEATLTPEQLTNYHNQIAARSARRKQALVRMVVARLDSALYLTSEQREKLSTALSDAWQESWDDWSLIVRYPANYIPDGIYSHIAPHLNSRQADAWNGLLKINPNQVGMFQDENGIEPDDWWGNDSAQPNEAKSTESETADKTPSNEGLPKATP